MRATAARIKAKGRYQTVVNIVSIDEVEALRTRIDRALAELDRGEFVDGEELMQRMRDELDPKEADHKAG